MEILFVTKNQHKYSEACSVFSDYGIKIVQIREDKIEPKDMNLEQVASLNAENFYRQFRKPIMIDDTGVYFKEYPLFPGNHPKLMFELLGYKGLLNLVKGGDRSAWFETVVGYHDGELHIFKGTLAVVVSDKVYDIDKDVMPYERIFLVNNKPLSRFSRKEKNRISHRGKAFKMLAEFLKKRMDNRVKSTQ